MIAVLATELLKLRRSLALALVIAAPASLCGLALLILLDRERLVAWPTFLDGTTAIWAYFMLPMSVASLSVLLAQIEHGPKTWDHLLALPGWRGRFFAAKLAVLVLLTLAMTLLVGTGVVATGYLANALHGGALVTGDPPLPLLVGKLVRMWAAATLLSVLQLWLALRVRGFVPPLVLGMVGTLVGVVAAGAKYGVYMPWLLPVNMLSTPERVATALTTSLLGSALLLPLMLVDLSRRERG